MQSRLYMQSLLLFNDSFETLHLLKKKRKKKKALEFLISKKVLIKNKK